jgi:hypothetical protein
MPVHIAFEQTYAHEEIGFHAPVPSHASCVGLVGLHRKDPGAHAPPQTLPAQRKAHGLPSSQPPFAWHVERALFSHFVVPGTQMPTHAPCMQRFGHVASTCQSPSPLQVRSVTPSQSFWPGSQMLAPASGPSA